MNNQTNNPQQYVSFLTEEEFLLNLNNQVKSVLKGINFDKIQKETGNEQKDYYLKIFYHHMYNNVKQYIIDRVGQMQVIKEKDIKDFVEKMINGIDFKITEEQRLELYILRSNLILSSKAQYNYHREAAKDMISERETQIANSTNNEEIAKLEKEIAIMRKSFTL